MGKIIYLDVLLSVNFIIDWMLIKLSGRLARAKTTKIRCCLGALLGTAVSLSILLPDMGALFSAIISLFGVGAMAACAYGVKEKALYFRTCLWMLLLGACYAGAMLAVWFFICPAGMEIKNGVVYLDIQPELIIMISVLCYLVFTLLSRSGFIKCKTDLRCTVVIMHKNKCVHLDGLLDTGNLLTEPISGLPVIVAEESDINDIMPKYMSAFLDGKDCPGENVRIVPYNTIHGKGIAAAFKPQNIEITYNGKKVNTEAYVLPRINLKSESNYSAIVGANIIEM